ncbi:MATE family efflux transporter [uncultured Holdemanella sp.]|uniref:MATE family efflux transporter n=1 Tax=uncultured Holdemanella sp. TaxID=1763549 RepID=UPI002805F307|nr:MATE family efflux transporter [uncultured Holdemanella sp.]
MKKNQSVNLLQGPIFKSLSLLAIPIMATYFIQMAYNLVDMLWIGYLGSGAVASIGVSGNFMYLANGLVNMPKVGSQALVGQSLGAQNKKETRAYIQAAFQSAIFFAVVYGIIIILFQKSLIQLFNLTDPTIIQDAQNYLWITCGFVLFSFVNQIFTGILTAAGHSKSTFIATTTGLVLNLILDPILIFVFDLKVVGAALATIIAQFIVTLVFLYDARNLEIFNEFQLLSKPEKNHIAKILKIGFPTSVQSMLFTCISMYIARLISAFGAISVAVQKVGSQIESISWMAADGFSASINAFTSQNYGAKNYTRVNKGYKTGMLVVSLWGFLTTCILIFLPGPIFSCFIHETNILPYGIDYLRILGYSQLFMCVEIATQGAFNGLGKTLPPSIVSIVFTSARIPMAILFSHYLGVNGVWWAISISSMIKGIVLVTWFIFYSKRRLIA